MFISRERNVSIETHSSFAYLYSELALEEIFIQYNYLDKRMDDFGTNQKITEKTDDEYAGGPGKTYEIYTQSEIITERLKLLDYENEIVNFSDSLKAIPR